MSYFVFELGLITYFHSSLFHLFLAKLFDIYFFCFRSIFEVLAFSVRKVLESCNSI